MEKVSHDLAVIPVFLMILAALGAFDSGDALAGTILLRPPAVGSLTDAGPGGEYPESRFGAQPSRISSRDHFASSASGRSTSGFEAQGEEEDVYSEGAGRSPASSLKVSELESGAVRRKGVQEIAVIASDLGFFPKTFFVSRDVPVRLFVTGSSKHALCIMMDSFQVRKQVRSQKVEEITFTPSTPGTYRYYCPVNGMEGTMVVKELASAQQEN